MGAMDTEQIFDRQTYGRLLRAARIIAGHDAVATTPALILERTGYMITERTIYALERGEQEPTVSQFAALTMALDPPGGLIYWASAFHSAWGPYALRRGPNA